MSRNSSHQKHCYSNKLEYNIPDFVKVDTIQEPTYKSYKNCIIHLRAFKLAKNGMAEMASLLSLRGHIFIKNKKRE